MKDLEFSYNWNNKLDCKVFTTIRIANPKVYKIGEDYKIHLNKSSRDRKVLGIAKILDIKTFKAKQLNSFMAYLDTAYSVEQTLKVMERMYQRSNIYELEFYYILLKYENSNKENQTSAQA